jgi:hypothetical protein
VLDRLQTDDILIRVPWPWKVRGHRLRVAFSDGVFRECRGRFSRQPVACFIATRNGAACGFLLRRGLWISLVLRGRPKWQKREIGTGLLLAGLEALRAQGYAARMLIGWAGPAGFFQKTVGAKIIENWSWNRIEPAEKQIQALVRDIKAGAGKGSPEDFLFLSNPGAASQSNPLVPCPFQEVVCITLKMLGSKETQNIRNTSRCGLPGESHAGDSHLRLRRHQRSRWKSRSVRNAGAGGRYPVSVTMRTPGHDAELAIDFSEKGNSWSTVRRRCGD